MVRGTVGRRSSAGLGARHQTLSEFEHLLAARLLRRDRVEVLHLVQTEVEVRNLADYDSELGLLTNADDGAA